MSLQACSNKYKQRWSEFAFILKFQTWVFSHYIINFYPTVAEYYYGLCGFLSNKCSTQSLETENGAPFDRSVCTSNPWLPRYNQSYCEFYPLLHLSCAITVVLHSQLFTKVSFFCILMVLLTFQSVNIYTEWTK